jgi:hypothetical protein
MSIQEVLFFSDRLEQAGMPRGAFVVNRFREPPPGPNTTPTAADAATAAQAHGLRLEDDAAPRLVQAHADAIRLAALDAFHVRGLDARAEGRVPIVRVPELTSDVRDLRTLNELAGILMSGGL